MRSPGAFCGKMRSMRLTLLFLILLPLAGCDLINEKLGIEDPAKRDARLEGEGRAVGSACRQSGRAIEDCYSIYSWLPKSAVYAGWRDMDGYMRENKLETVEPQLPPPPPPGQKRRKIADDEVIPVKPNKSAAKSDEPPGEKADAAPDGAAGKPPAAEKPAAK